MPGLLRRYGQAIPATAVSGASFLIRAKAQRGEILQA